MTSQKYQTHPTHNCNHQRTIRGNIPFPKTPVQKPLQTKLHTTSNPTPTTPTMSFRNWRTLPQLFRRQSLYTIQPRPFSRKASPPSTLHPQTLSILDHVAIDDRQTKENEEELVTHWECPLCTRVNLMVHPFCEICDAKKSEPDAVKQRHIDRNKERESESERERRRERIRTPSPSLTLTPFPGIYTR